MPDPRTEVDANLQCPCCGGVPFRVWRVQNLGPDAQPLASWSHVVKAAEEGTEVPPGPDYPCPRCGELCRRVKA